MSQDRNAICRWHAFADEGALRLAAYDIVLDAAVQAIGQRGQFHLVLAGGDTPRKLYSALSGAQADWSAWHIYFGDERCLPLSDPQRNSRMAAESWLDFVPIPDFQLHRIPAEHGAARAAAIYSETLKTVGIFDLVLLGLGEDGHTASLFPGQEWGAISGSPDVLAVRNAPKPPKERVTLSAARLRQTRKAIFLITGEAKHRAVCDWRSGKDIPARAITPPAGVDVLLESSLLLPMPPER